MDRTLTAVQADIDSTKNAKAQGNVEQWQHDLWDEQLEGFEKEKEALLAQEIKFEEHVATNGYLLDTLTASNGMTMAELSYSPENHELVCIAVQKAFLAQQDAFNSKIASLDDENRMLKLDLATAKDQEETDGFVIQQVELENADLVKRLKNATDIIAENDIEIKQQAAKISALLEQQATSAIPVASLSAEEQEAKLINEINGKQIKVYNVRPKHENAVTNTMFIANNAITGAEFEDHYLYLCKINEDKPKRYKEISEAEAEQLRADYANKKAEIQASIPSIPHVEPLVTPEIPALQEVHTHTPQESTITHTEGDSSAAGNQPLDEVVDKAAEENISEPIPHDEMLAKLYQAHNELKADHASLTARVDNIERHANIQAVA